MRFLKASLLAVLTTILFALTAPGAYGGVYGETTYHALLIGNENYQGAAAPGAITDASLMAQALQAANDAGGTYRSPSMRTNLKASDMTGLVSGMREQGIDDDDVTLLFYSGQGTLAEDGSACLIGQDGSLLKVADLRAGLDDLPGTKLVVMDVRYPDAQNGGRGGEQAVSSFTASVADAFRGGATQQRYQVICGCTLLSSGVSASEALSVQSGSVSYYLVKGVGYDYFNKRSDDLLADADGNHSVTLSEARDYVLSNMSALAQEKGIALVSDVTVYPENSRYPLLSRRSTADMLSITLDHPALSIPSGRSAKLSATILPINAQGKEIRWISSDLGVATVDEDGLVWGVRPGEAYVTAVAANGMTAECRVLIRDVVFAESVSLSHSKLTIGGGQEQLLQLTMLPVGSNELITWTSNDSSIASVNENGLVRTLHNGSAVVTATTEGGKEVSCVIQVVDPERVVNAIRLDRASAEIYEGQAFIPTPVISPANAADPGVTWTSSDESVAAISVAGANTMVVGEGAGEAVITATTSNGLTASLTVSVKGAQVIFAQNDITLRVGAKGPLRYGVLPQGSMLEIAWESSNPEVISVTADGVVEALQNGVAEITATLPSGTQSVCRLSVATVVVRDVSISRANLVLLVGAQAQLAARANPADASIPDLTWLSSNEDIVQVDESGNLTGVGVGRAVVGARAHNGRSARCTVIVAPASVTSIALNETQLSLVLGEDDPVQLTAQTEPFVTQGNRALQWISGNPRVAAVDANGLVTPIGFGTTVIRAQSGGVHADCRVVVGLNRTFNATPVIGQERRVYESLRQIIYNNDTLVVQMYYVNRTTRPAPIPPSGGTLILTLASGATHDLLEIQPSTKALAAGKADILTFSVPLSSNEALRGLNLQNAQVSLAVPAADTPDGGIASDGSTPDAFTQGA